MIKNLKKSRLAITLIIYVLMSLFGTLAMGNSKNNWRAIIGYWQTLDDRTGKPAGVMHIFLKNGKFVGRLVKSYSVKSIKDSSRCTKCRDARKNKPVLGMMLIRNLYWMDGSYGRGYILDPRSGKEYRVAMTVIDNGKRLKVRGYIGISLLGRTMYWKRVNKPKGAV